MAKVEAESKDEAMRSKTAVRCAKAAFLLSSLKSSQNRHLKATVDQQAKEKEMLRKAVGDLKIELVRERLRNKRIKLCAPDSYLSFELLPFYCLQICLNSHGINSKAMEFACGATLTCSRSTLLDLSASILICTEFLRPAI
ncbi:unnamed protein product [Citrullus colocynthis]|uniref:Uncharacterized protein n=1 Tax=Citrullus colocynthis TaxID=252529 RepID=A0ABP0YY61_9ROSI